jgi:hypothetical protein
MTRSPAHPPFSDQPVLSTSDLEAQVAAATPDDMVRCVRIVLGMSGAFWERDFDSGTVWYSPTFFRVLGLPQDIHMREPTTPRCTKAAPSSTTCAFSTTPASTAGRAPPGACGCTPMAARGA